MRILSRFFTPILLLGAAAYIGWHNQQDGDTIAFFFLGSFFPDVAGDPKGMGELTVGILAAVGAVTFATALRREQLRFKPPKDD